MISLHRKVSFSHNDLEWLDFHMSLARKKDRSKVSHFFHEWLYFLSFVRDQAIEYIFSLFKDNTKYKHLLMRTFLRSLIIAFLINHMFSYKKTSYLHRHDFLSMLSRWHKSILSIIALFKVRILMLCKNDRS